MTGAHVVAARTARHAPAVALFAGLTVVWTFPLVLHLSTHVPGNPGDNYSFLWNLWWMRHALDSGEPYFHSRYLFHPIGVDLVNHPHTALQALISATLFRPLTTIVAENLYILGSIFANAIAAYALAFDITRQRRAAILAGVIFGGSPYIAAHLLGHFDLLSAWVVPAFALAFRRALAHGSRAAMAAAGVVLCVAAYTAYYYVVYLGLFAVAYFVGGSLRPAVELTVRATSRPIRWWRALLATLLAADVAFIVWIVVSGGAVLRAGPLTISSHTPQNPLTAAWLLAFGVAMTRWRVAIRWPPAATPTWGRGAITLGVVGLVFVLGTSPLIVQAASLAAQGRYVSQTYFWRTSPAGVDLASFILGNPFHPLTRDVTGPMLDTFNIDRIEAVAWLGVVPLVLLLGPRGRWTDPGEARCWRIVVLIALVWALGPRLMVAGVDAGLPLPQSVARFVPVVSNARMPGRAMLLVYLSVGVLCALRLGALRRVGGNAPLQWALIALVLVDYVGAPLPLTRLEHPRVYDRLAALHDGGAVCEVPFGIGDGLSGGVGSQARDVLYYATLHEHPLVGGYIGRMPPGAEAAYREMPVVGDLLRLSAGKPARPAAEGDTPLSPCWYLVVDRASVTPPLDMYIRSTMKADLIGAADGRELYEVRPEHRLR